MDGFRVTASFNVETFACSDLASDVQQLAILLYPPETFNEQFLLNIRNCMLQLNDSHPVKKWLKHVSSPVKPSATDQGRLNFTTEILNSPFNLITDQKVKGSVIDLISHLPRVTIAETLLVSYLYLMIGNITRSDNLIKTILNQEPRRIFSGYGSGHSIYHHLASQNLDKIFKKLARHPADRRTFDLLNSYLLSYMNHPELMKIVNDVKTDNLDKKLGLLYLEKIAPGLVSFLRLETMSSDRKIKNLRDHERYPLSMQSQWVWPFIDVGSLVSEQMAEELKKTEASDPLWLIYLMEEERLADLYLKKGGTFTIPKKRQFLRGHLNGGDFMLTLFKLIELGDIDSELVLKTSAFLTHE